MKKEEKEKFEDKLAKKKIMKKILLRRLNYMRFTNRLFRVFDFISIELNI